MKNIFPLHQFKKIKCNTLFADLFMNYVQLIIVFFAVLFIPAKMAAQSIPVGTLVLEDAFRRAQLLGQIDSLISFTSFPLFANSSQKLNTSFEPHHLSANRLFAKSDIMYRSGKKGTVQLLPFTWQQQYNTHHPYSLNDGAMIPARGYQTMVSGGFYAQYGPLSIQIQPEYVFAENKDFQGFYKEHSDLMWEKYYGQVLNFIDLPEKFGNGSYRRLLWGQSSLRLTLGPFSAGISNENLWWGPGIRNSLVMSNTASGFKHMTLNTVRPVKTFIGSFELQIISGDLDNSGFDPPGTNRMYSDTMLYIPKRNDLRYINGMLVSYHPRWVPGLFVGVTRSFISYYKDMGNTFADYLPIITPITKKANYGNKESPYPQDQRASFFFRWLWKEEKAELYWEFGREDHAFNLRDFIVQPYHTSMYILGFRKLIPLIAHKDQYIQIKAELTQLAQIGTNTTRPTGSIYLYYAGISQGYTHRGQLLGAGIGPGSNMQVLSLNWVKSLKTFGIQVERYVHNNDFAISLSDTRTKWVDFTTAVIGEYDYKNLLFSFRFEMIRSYNYQYLYNPVTVENPTYWTPGRNIYDYQGKVGVSYRF